MARYGDLETLAVKWIQATPTQKQNFKQIIDTHPTADVVPKSEVDLYKRQVDELEDELATTYDKLEKAKAEVAREIFEEIENFIPRFSVGYFSYASLTEGIAELKKKYTEEALK